MKTKGRLPAPFAAELPASESNQQLTVSHIHQWPH